ncbi:MULTISPECIES: heavy-metal-associated domain-containing protein [Planomicrobium]|uniref:heavy-metal-associated domain-containing protein n=1 Tax=Planomicrobium TaxID=162291 RepID=UPI000C7A4D66|nr:MULTISPECIES: heavy-metal-associated domain-containing protein [Planomicrobium]PKH08654.1 heavy metal-binding protein [Planomicrobium sp. MB-3u-38]
MMKVTFKMEPLTCPSCIKKIENAVMKIQGVESVDVLFHAGKVKVVYNDELVSALKVEETIVRLGYPVLSTKVA